MTSQEITVIISLVGIVSVAINVYVGQGYLHRGLAAAESVRVAGIHRTTGRCLHYEVRRQMREKNARPTAGSGN